ncbi:(3S,6E)-nerolidol synthase 1-like [Cucumis melo var. makuwa]|uniref:(3S,6E)-nerolidol synthase 1-like n=1 Tax=Cucumis melo var. makuwa TaxID=1194695 RepID=A0A5D3BI68_CUCMM|nr:(3S,6E)-nerolidol synthase 1-like [Cucumis melo var. makuwa]
MYSYQTNLGGRGNKQPTNGIEYGKGAIKGRILKDVLREIGDPWECLNLIDATQRLGIDYHFQEEIEAVLQRQYVLFNAVQFNPETDLHKAALLFRLFRQQGYLVSADVFKSFMDKKGKFKEDLREDIKGLSSLYEASHLCIHGDEIILEEAEIFSRRLLNARGEAELANFVRNTLSYPHHKSVVQLTTLNYFEDHMQCPNKWIHIFQDAAKMELYCSQRLRQNEVAQFMEWWKDTELGKELNFARDQPIKWYMASLVCLTDSFYSEQRIQLAKSITFIYLIDDLFDVFGTLDELTLFTEAVYRWDLAAAEGLPDCMKICLRSLFEVTDEISYQIYQKHSWNPIHFLHKAWAKLCKAFLVEAEWLRCGHSPSAEEYLKNGIVSTGIPLTLLHAFLLLGQQITDDTVQIVDDDLDIVSSTATVLRLWDDFGTAEDETQEGRDGSYLEYYMKENPSISYEETQQHTMKKISNAWKTLNRESLLSNQFPSKFNQACLNVARAVPLAYNYDRNKSIVSMENLVKKLLFSGMEM